MHLSDLPAARRREFEAAPLKGGEQNAPSDYSNIDGYSISKKRPLPQSVNCRDRSRGELLVGKMAASI
jgi:hypothetical protein